MINKIKVGILSLAVLPLVSAAFYLEPRASIMFVGDKAAIGDIGVITDSDESEFVPSLVAGFTLTERVALEFRYARIGEFSTSKQSPTWQIFPSDVTLPAVRYYVLTQETNLFSVTLPLTVYSHGKFKATLTPVASYEETDTVIYDVSPNVSQVQGATIVNRTEREFQPGAEFALEYGFSASTAARLHYFYSPMKNYDAHFVGAGLNFKF